MQPDQPAARDRDRARPTPDGRGTMLWMLASSVATVGAWALFAPESFHADFVFGRAWVALDGLYNEHLVRDVGALNLALAVVTATAAVRRDAFSIRLAASSTLVYALPHLAYHSTTMAPFPPGDAVAQLLVLTMQVLAPLLLLWRPVPCDRTPTRAPAARAGIQWS